MDQLVKARDKDLIEILVFLDLMDMEIPVEILELPEVQEIVDLLLRDLQDA